MIGAWFASAVMVLADPAPLPPLPSTTALLEELKQSPEGSAQLPIHHRLLGHYWRDVASDGDKALPEVELLAPGARFSACGKAPASLSLIHISEPTRLRRISYAVFCLKKKN